MKLFDNERELIVANQGSNKTLRQQTGTDSIESHPTKLYGGKQEPAVPNRKPGKFIVRQVANQK